MDLEKLSDILRTEKETDNIQDLHENIENEITTYLNMIKNAEDECSDYKELSMIRDEYKNAMLIIEGLIERRFAKLVNYAAISITRQNALSINIQNSDKIIFETLCNQMKEHKKNMLLSNCMVVKK